MPRFHLIATPDGKGRLEAFTQDEETARDAEEAKWLADKPLRDAANIKRNREAKFTGPAIFNALKTKGILTDADIP